MATARRSSAQSATTSNTANRRKASTRPSTTAASSGATVRKKSSRPPKSPSRKTNVTVTKLLKEAMCEYSVESLRAIPDLRDGLKTVQRCILWAAEEHGLQPTRPHMKVAEHAGLVMAYHPHGSSEGAIVELAQEWKRGMPLIDISGNRGNVSGAPAAAGRYINSRQSLEGSLLCEELKYRPVPFTKSYSGKDMPKVLPSKFPIALAIGQKGIAEAMATTILPHNPIELIDGAVEVIRKPALTAARLAKIVRGPDFPLGGYLVEPGEAAIAEAETGQARYVSCGRWEIDSRKTSPSIRIVEPPFDVDVTTLIESIATTLEPVKKPLKVTDIESVGAEDKCDIRISMARGATVADMEKVVTYLRQKSKLESRLSCTNRLLWEGRPLVHGTLDFLRHWVEFRLVTLRGVWGHQLAETEAELSKVVASITLIDRRDEIVKLAMEANKSSDELAAKLEAKIGFTPDQAKYVANMALWKLSKPIGNERRTLVAKKKELEGKVADLTKKINDDDTAKTALIADLREVKAVLKKLGYGERKTEIISGSDADDIEGVTPSMTDLVERKPMRLIVNANQTMHRIGPKAYLNQRDSDSSVVSRDCSTTDFAVAMTSSGQAVVKLVNDLELASLTDSQKLEPLYKSMQGVNSVDAIVGGGVASLDKEAENEVLVVLTKHGRLKVMRMSDMVPAPTATAWKRKALPAIGLSGDDEVILAKQMNRSEMADMALTATMLKLNGNTRSAEYRLSRAKTRSDSFTKSTGIQAFNTKSGTEPVVEFTLA